MDEALSRGDAEEAPALIQDKGVKWYIPHHGVYHPKKNKIRVSIRLLSNIQGNFLKRSSAQQI